MYFQVGSKLVPESFRLALEAFRMGSGFRISNVGSGWFRVVSERVAIGFWGGAGGVDEQARPT